MNWLPNPTAPLRQRWTRAFAGQAWIIALVALWIGGIGVGTGLMMRHENTPGAPAAPLAQWPSGAVISPAQDAAYTVVMLAHPRCPCTRASLHELAKLNTEAAGNAKIYVFFMLPPNADDGWKKAANWRIASEIPGARVLADPEGKQADIFGAKTSGQTLIYDRSGALRFRGGLTGSRGNEEENAAYDAAAHLLRKGVAPKGALPVFGCPLREETDDAPKLTAAAKT